MPIYRPSDQQERIQATLEDCATALREANPGKFVYIDNGAVWIRSEKDGKDYGMYSATILGDVRCCVDSLGATPLHRPILEAIN